MFFGKRFSRYHESSLSGLEILVLSLIKKNPGATGYDLIQFINKKFKKMWKASPGTIYPLLERLSNKNFITSEEIIDENNRKKKVYRILDEGDDLLKKVLANNFEPSLRTLGEFIRTITEGVTNQPEFEHIFSCFPFCSHSEDREIDEKDISRENLINIERIITQLKHRRESLQGRLNKLDMDIQHFTELLNTLKQKREKEAKPIPIIEDDTEFENF